MVLLEDTAQGAVVEEQGTSKHQRDTVPNPKVSDRQANFSLTSFLVAVFFACVYGKSCKVFPCLVHLFKNGQASF